MWSQSLNANVVLHGLVLREVAVRLRLVVAMGALAPLYADVVDIGLVHREVAVLLRLVVAMGKLVPRQADVVLVGLVLRDVAVRRGPMFAALVVAELPEHINIEHGGSVLLEGSLQLRLVLATELSASMPTNANAVLMSRSLFALYDQLCSGHSCQETPISCTRALCRLMLPCCFALYSHPSSGQ